MTVFEEEEEEEEDFCCAGAMDKICQGLVSHLQAVRKKISRKDRSRGQGRWRPLLLPQPFPVTENPAAREPSTFWSPVLRNVPLPTNAAWLNLVLNQGSVPEYFHPYLVQVKDGALTVCFPSRIVQPSFIIQAFVPNLTISSSDPGRAKHMVSSYDDLSVTLELPGHITVPLVRGCPYITYIFHERTLPKLSTGHAVLSFFSNETHTKHKLSMNNGQTWLIYSSKPLLLDPNLEVRDVFQGVLRIALLSGDDEAEMILDRYSVTFPLEGHADISVPFQIRYEWTKSNSRDLLMLSLPMHREMMSWPGKECIYPSLSYNSIDGKMQAVASTSWILNESPVYAGWFSSRGIPEPGNRKELVDVLMRETALLKPVTTDSTYFHSKALARAARMALIAEEIGCLDVLQTVRDFLRSSMTPWMEGSFSGNCLLYDSKWGGLISRNGSIDPGADFGLAVYNDHHYHMGYFCYAGAVLSKLDPGWGATYKAHLYTIAEDYMTSLHSHKPASESAPHRPIVVRSQPLFPRFRNFDFWVLHSWAGGLTEFADGRNQESTSEAVNAYYAASLLGRAFQDSRLVDVGLTLAAFEIRAARTLWHVPSNSSLYEPDFVSSNRMVGVLWANKRDTGLWFAQPECRECRLGIQLLPILPITEHLFQDLEFVRELVEWVWPSLSRPDVKDGWKGFAYALQALYAPDIALQHVAALAEHDDGNSLSNMLWWIYSR